LTGFAATHEGKEAFFTSSLLQDAVIRTSRSLVRRPSGSLLRPRRRRRRSRGRWWRACADVLIHGYFGVDLEIVWSVVDQRLPELAEVVDRLLAT
jgi:uncharacterized protein with HEPN domain